MTGIKTDDNHQFIVRRRDFYVDETDGQDEINILYANKGNFFTSPTLGAELMKFQNSPMSKPELEKICRKELQKDNVSVTSVTVTNTGDRFDVKLITSRNER